MLPKWIPVFTLLVAVANILGYDSVLDDPGKLFLEAELALARKPGLYFIFDLKDKRISLKARGILLQEWEVKRVRYWGNPAAVKPTALAEKTALLPPKRERIEPGCSDENGAYELKALELDDMPSYYTLSLTEGILLYVRPQARGWISSFFAALYTLRWHVFLPLKTVWSSIRKKPFASIEIVLKDKRESRALFWAFTEGMPCIIS